MYVCMYVLCMYVCTCTFHLHPGDVAIHNDDDDDEGLCVDISYVHSYHMDVSN